MPIAHHDSFPKRRIARKIGLALSGGGAKGSFEVGSLKYLYSKIPNFSPDVIIGTSVGSINGIKLAEGEGKIGSYDLGLVGLEKIWLNLKDDEDMSVLVKGLEDYEKEIMDVLKGPIVEGVITIGVASGLLVGAMVASMGIGLIVAAIVPQIALRIIDNVKEKIKEEIEEKIDDFLNERSIFTIEPIEKLLRQTGRDKKLDLKLVKKSKIEYMSAVVGLRNGKLRYVDKHGEMFERDELKKPIATGLDPLAGVMASSAIPVMFPPVWLHDDDYVDGGVREVLPLDAVISKLNLNKHLLKKSVYAIMASKPDGSNNEKNSEQNTESKITLDYQLLRTLGIMLDEVKRGDKDQHKKFGKTITLIQPQVEIHGTQTIDPGLIRINIDYGYMRAYEVCELNIDAYQERTYASEIAMCRKKIWAAEDALINKLNSGAYGFNDLQQTGSRYKSRSIGRGGTTFDYAIINLDYQINEIRKMKIELLDLILNKPANYSWEIFPYFKNSIWDGSWWEQWETHKIEPQLLNPWMGYREASFVFSDGTFGSRQMPIKRGKRKKSRGRGSAKLEWTHDEITVFYKKSDEMYEKIKRVKQHLSSLPQYGKQPVDPVVINMGNLPQPKKQKAAPKKASGKAAPRRTPRKAAPKKASGKAAPRRTPRKAAPKKASGKAAPRRTPRKAAPKRQKTIRDVISNMKKTQGSSLFKTISKTGSKKKK